MTTTVLTKKVSQISIGPACPARLAAARLRRAFVLPILAAPPVRATQTLITMESKDRKCQIVLNYEGKMVYKKRNYWLVLTRTSLAGFNAPIDSKAQDFDSNSVHTSDIRCHEFLGGLLKSYIRRAA